jgi:hypothetical protein
MTWDQRAEVLQQLLARLNRGSKPAASDASAAPLGSEAERDGSSFFVTQMDEEAAAAVASST